MAAPPDWLDTLKIASPCPMTWEGMTGDARRRFCDRCRLHVYDVAGLTRGEAEALVSGSEGGVCVRLTRRADGTVLTRDCPVGLAAARAALRRWLAAGVALAAALIGMAAVIVGSGSRARARGALPAALRGVVNLFTHEERRVVMGYVPSTYFPTYYPVTTNANPAPATAPPDSR